MNLDMPAHLALDYKSLSQKVRVVSESWGEANLYCPNCSSPALDSAPNNTQAFDYICPNCKLTFQLKSKSSPFGDRILDAGYDAMIRAIQEERTPNLYALHYDKVSWRVENLILIPHFALLQSAIEPRKPLSSTARRAGWVGCFIALKNIPSDAKIHLVSNGNYVHNTQVRKCFRRLRPLQEISLQERSWSFDVLRIARSLGKKEFSNSDIYNFTLQLQKLHPKNNHIEAKIRRQLQFLRDKGFLMQVQRGIWALTDFHENAF